MAISTTLIDPAAKGWLRHRFVRALAASWLVLIVVGLCVFMVYAVAQTPMPGAGELVGVAIAAPIFLIAFLVPVLLGAAIGGALLDLVHRRLIACVAFAFNLAIVVFAGILIFGGLGQFFGILPASDGVERTASWSWNFWTLIVLSAVAALLAWESLAWAGWQVMVSREGFLAARGWRPPVWRLFSTIRRHLGLPAYISQFGRGRFSLTLLYFCEALLNTGLVALLILPFAVFGELDKQGGQTTILIGITVFGGLFLLNLFRAGHLIDWLADRRATRMYQDVREWDARAPIVFLRAFDQDDAKLPAVSRDPIVKFPAGVGAARSLDEILLEHASPLGPVIAIGNPRDPTPPLGAARVHAPGEGLAWQDIVTQLVAASKAVVICPKGTEGVKWELDMIARVGAQARTIYLANPELTGTQNTELFARLAPAGEALTLEPDAAPIAAFIDPKLGFRVLATRMAPCVQSYTIALNMALFALFGRYGVPLTRPRAARALEKGGSSAKAQAAA